MRDAVGNPIAPIEVKDTPQGPTFGYLGSKAFVSLNEAGEVVTCWGTRREGLRDS
jgi:hypothetical protein